MPTYDVEKTTTSPATPRVSATMKALVCHGPGKRRPGKLVTHRSALNDVMKAYDTFGNAAKEGALKAVLTTGGPR